MSESEHTPPPAAPLDDDCQQESPVSAVGVVLRARTRSPLGLSGALVWLAFILFPLINAVSRHQATFAHLLAIVGAAVFVVTYVVIVVRPRRIIERPSVTPILFGILLAVATALTASGKSGWGFLFAYCAACAAMFAPPRLGVPAVGLCVALAAASGAIGGASGGAIVGYVATTAGIGLLMLLVHDLRVRNDQLVEARAELAKLAVAQERERFARDLHDLLGHTLSVIALKAELAGRLLPSRVDDAGREIADVEQVARSALGEVRQAVSGYRQPTLDGELAGARMALSAAGIEADVTRASAPLDPAVEAVLAWAVREGATNVIRHSGASHCAVRIAVSLTDASAEILDDGVGETHRNGLVGGHRNGIGRAEAPGGRAEAPGGRAEAPGGRAEAPGGRAEAPGGRADAPGGRAESPGIRQAAPNGSRAPGHAGHGLEGLAERAAALKGTVEAGFIPEGGFRLVVRIPAGARVPAVAP